MAEDRATRLSRVLTRRLRKLGVCSGLTADAETTATIVRTRYKDEDAYAWRMKVKKSDGGEIDVMSVAPANEVVSAKDWTLKITGDEVVIKLARED